MAVAPTPGINLVLWCDTVPADQQSDHAQYWAKRAWRGTEYILAEPSQTITLTATGDSPSVRLDTMQDKILTQAYGFLRVNRSFLNAAYFNLIKLPDNAKIRIETQTGTEIFTTNGEYMDFMKYQKETKQIMDNNFGFFSSFPVLFWDFGHLSVQLLTEKVEGAAIFNGLENVIIRDAASTQAVYLDILGQTMVWYCMSNGKLHRVIKP